MTRLLALLVLAAPAAQDFSAGSFLGKAPPDLASEARHWLNSKEALKLATLKGKVVWLEFGFLN
jgi:hypothetical protein